MLNEIVLFRISVLGTLTSRLDLNHGEIKQMTHDIAKQEYIIPGSNRTHISARTIERWYAKWKKHGPEGLSPKFRKDKGLSKITKQVKKRIIELKSENMCRSVNTLLALMFDEGYGKLPRSSVHRLLKQSQLSHRVVSDAPNIERRQFEARKAGDIWYSDVMHGPMIARDGKAQKAYLVSYMDDASRLLTHTEFCWDEQATSIEYVLKEAVMRRGLPKRLIIDNGSAYRSGSLTGICARLDIRLIFCRPYEPEGKGKLERWHRTVRAQFLNELNPKHIGTIDDLNDRLHAWIQEVYHQRKHGGLNQMSPLERFRLDIPHTRRLGDLAKHIDEIFYHRKERSVNKTGVITFQGKLFEVPYRYAAQKVHLVFDPYTQEPKFVETLDGEHLCAITPLNKHSNLGRQRQRPTEITSDPQQEKSASQVENALKKHKSRYTLKDKS